MTTYRVTIPAPMSGNLSDWQSTALRLPTVVAVKADTAYAQAGALVLELDKQVVALFREWSRVERVEEPST